MYISYHASGGIFAAIFESPPLMIPLILWGWV